MFLLIRCFFRFHSRQYSLIYIPLCFYLYGLRRFRRCDTCAIIYIPLCFYLYTKRISYHLAHHHLHSTMFLLIPRPQGIILRLSAYLHSTMFLLIPISGKTYSLFGSIYIPLCFYLYGTLENHI